MKKLILKTRYSLGDVVMMTAAVRDLHRCYPKQFVTDVRTHYPELWEFNPHLTYLEESEEDVTVLDCRYPLINHANSRPYHCLHGYIDFLNKRLDLNIKPTEFKGDIHLSREEKQWASQVHELTGADLPFWIVSAGGKYDITTKWWSTERYQQVVDHFRGRIAFVQIGELGHHHPKLGNAVDLRGQTTVRELVRLVYHAQGCLGPVTALMHLAAAVETKKPFPRNRACVVIAGGREPISWEAYPHHQFLHTVGALDCCSQGGCWKSRVLPLGDGDERDKPDGLCSNVHGKLPRCMSMISPEDVARRIEGYFEGGALQYLTRRADRAAAKGIASSQGNTYDLDSLNRHNAPEVLLRAVRALPKYPGGFSGRGIVICGGGLKYFPCAWVCVQMLRHFGCRLPIQIWHRGAEEMDRNMIGLVGSLGVECVNAGEVEKKHPRRMGGGWELKPYALIHSRFAEVLLLDADNVPIRDPSYLFDEPEYARTGSIFWPDYGCLAPDREIWKICGIPYRKEAEFESGQMVVDKRRCWRALNLALWFNEHSDFYFEHIHGDKETFHLAWRKLGKAYTMIKTPLQPLDGIMCQHDFRGRRLFQHRNTHKWRAFGANKRVKGFLHEDLCLEFLADLRNKWDGIVHPEATPAHGESAFTMRSGTSDQWVYFSVVERNEYKLPKELNGRDVILDVGAHIGSFSLACLKRGAKRILAFEPESQNFRIAQHNLRPFAKQVRLFQKAVWRSDRATGTLLHSGYVEEETEVNTGGGTVLPTFEATLQRRKKESVGTVSLDKVLRPFRRIGLLKLDCEGSEWPILFTSKQLHKVEKICGEFHELRRIPTPARVEGYTRYTRQELKRFLLMHYRKVCIRMTDGKLGLFWAEDRIPP